MSEPLPVAVALVVLVALAALLAAGESALLAARRGRLEVLEAEGNAAARAACRLLDDVATLRVAARGGGTLVACLGGALGALLAQAGMAGWLGGATGLAPTSARVASLVLAVLMTALAFVLVGDMVPRALALRNPEAVALYAARPLALVLRVLGFPARLLAARWERSLERDEAAAPEGGEVVRTHSRTRLLETLKRFTDIPVRQVMVPRTRIFGVDIKGPASSLAREVVESGYSRVPVFDGSIDNVVGVLHARDLLRGLVEGESAGVASLLHPPRYVPESKRAVSVLGELQGARTHLALVVDEHGAVSGLVTLEDLIEEIVGEIQDEHDREAHHVQQLRDGTLMVDGLAPSDELRDVWGLPVPRSDEFDTLAGFLLERLGHVPQGGEAVEIGDHRFTVVDVEGNRIARVKIEVSAPSTTG